MAERRARHSGLEINDFGLFCSGHLSDGICAKGCELFDLQKKSNKQVADIILPVESYGICEMMDNAVHVIGGWSGKNESGNV